MNSLIFRKGYKDWDRTYRIEIGFEYTADLEKKLTDVKIHELDQNRSITVPWNIFQSYLYENEGSIYAEPNGLTIRPTENGILVSDSRFMSIHIHEDQVDAIRRAAKNIKEDISSSVERILSEFTPARMFR